MVLLMELLKPGKVVAKCKCGCEFAFTPADAFKRYEICGMVNSGTFDRKEVIYVRCPSCKKRVRVTGKVASVAVTNDDPLCKCEGGYCRCED